MWKIIASIGKVLLVLGLLTEAAFLLAEKVDLTTADLGRHIENGKVILSQGLRSPVLNTNFYSYTQPDFPTINHHWGTGVIFYWLTQLGGFSLDSIFYIVTGLLTLLLVLDVARKISDFWIALGLSLLLLPLMMSRTEVRPEMITYFFSAVFFWILWNWTADKSANYNASLRGGQGLIWPTKQSYPMKRLLHPSAALRFLNDTDDSNGSEQAEGLRYKLIWILPIITLFWVNIHIGWFFGPLLIILFLGGEVWKNGFRKFFATLAHPWSKNFRNDTAGALLIMLLLCGVASLVNPNFLWGALEPLTIFQHYGYLIVENQTIPFLERINHTAGLHFNLIKTMIALLGAGVVATIIKCRRKVRVELILLGVTVAVMAWFGLRNFPFFGFFALPVLAYCLGEMVSWLPNPPAKSFISVADAVIIPLALFALAVSAAQTYQTAQARGIAEGIGLMPAAQGSADFFKANNINGPIFNDYDIGGYLIYNLYPEQKVFVDNRPEAYSVPFFQDVYIPAQEDPAKWQQLDNQYRFNAIFFSYRDLTPWAQTFLISRVNDPAWAPVFVDPYNIIFLKRNQQNDQLIKKYELPKSMFGVSK